MGNCTDKFEECKHVNRWCSRVEVIRKDCPLTCYTCPVVTTTPIPTEDSCKNLNQYCQYWADQGYCVRRYVAYMKKNCQQRVVVYMILLSNKILGVYIMIICATVIFVYFSTLNFYS